MRISDWSSDVCSSDLLCLIESGFNLAVEILSRRFDQYIDVGGDSRLDALHQQKVGYREMAFVGWRRKDVGIDQGPEIDGCEHAPLDEKLGLWRSEGRRGGKGGVRTCSYRWW